jgi:DNA ligase-4
MSKWKAEEPKTPDEDALREEDLQYGTSGLTEEELAAKYAVDHTISGT